MTVVKWRTALSAIFTGISFIMMNKMLNVLINLRKPTPLRMSECIQRINFDQLHIFLILNEVCYGKTLFFKNGCKMTDSIHRNKIMDSSFENRKYSRKRYTCQFQLENLQRETPLFSGKFSEALSAKHIVTTKFEEKNKYIFQHCLCIIMHNLFHCL